MPETQTTQQEYRQGLESLSPKIREFVEHELNPWQMTRNAQVYLPVLDGELPSEFRERRERRLALSRHQILHRYTKAVTDDSLVQ